MHGREFDVVVWGATGFTGGLVAEYLVQHGGEQLVWAIGGRDRHKLERVRREIGASAELPLIVGDASHESDMLSLAQRARVIISTVGPFSRHGLPLIHACAESGTDYCDSTGEVPFMRRAIDECHARAQKSGARLVPGCGFDSIPSDLGVLLLALEAERRGTTLTATDLVLTKARGGTSGGTVATMLEMVDQAKRDKAIRKLLLDPYALSPDRAHDLDVDGRDGLDIELDPHLGVYTAPFFMGSVNTRVVRRSNALLGFRYGREFRYRERMVGGKLARGLPGAVAIVGSLTGAALAASTSLTRSVLERLVPKPGEGPREEVRRSGFFKMSLFSTLADGSELRGQVAGIRDPGYGETAKMVAESALALLDPEAKQPGFEAGVLTPATALGMPLIERLRQAGMTFRIEG